MGMSRAALPRDGVWTALLLALFALYYITPGAPLSLVLLALCAVACYLRLPLAVSLVPLAMPFYMLPKHLGPHRDFSLGETAIVLCATVFALVQGRALLTSRGARRRVLRRLTHPTPLDLAIGLFLVAATATMLATHGELYHLALRQYRVAILEPILYYVLAASTLRGARAISRALWALAGAGLLVALLGLGQYVFRPGTLTGATWTGDTRHAARFVSAVYGSPDNLALLLDRAIPVAVVLGLLGLSARRAARASLLSYLPWLAVAPMAVALLLSNSRGGIIVAVAAAVAALLLWRARTDGRAMSWSPRARALAAGGLAAVLAVAGLALLAIYHGHSGSRRLLVWKSALAMIHDHPLLGVGPDNFLYYYFDPRTGIDHTHPGARSCLPGSLSIVNALPKHYMDPQAWQEPCLSHPHNIVLDLWLSTGLLGLVAMLAVIFIAGRYAWRSWRALQTSPATPASMGAGQDTTPPQAVLIASVVVVGATVAHGLVDNSLFLPDLAVDFWLAIALITNIRSVGVGVTDPSNQRDLRSAARG